MALCSSVSFSDAPDLRRFPPNLIGPRWFSPAALFLGYGKGSALPVLAELWFNDSGAGSPRHEPVPHGAGWPYAEETWQETVVASIPLNKLKPSPANVRRQRQDAAIEELAASIKVHGLLQMPVVRPELNGDDEPTGSYFVDVGESRRQALQLLAKRKTIKRSEPIDCMVRAGDGGAEISLAENVVRMPMHPADQFEAFARLQRESGLQPDEIAARFGITTRTVKQRLKLAAVSASLMERYRAGDLTLDQLMAFAVTDDRELQEQVHSELGDRASPFAIRRRLTSTYVEADDRRVLFVGLAAYEQAGGAVLRDLFSAEGEGWAMDSVLLDRLVMEKLQAVAEQLRSEGWQWIDVAIDYPHDRTRDMRRIFPEQVPLSDDDQASYDELCARHDELASSGDDLSDEELDEISELDVEIDALNARQSVFRRRGSGEVGRDRLSASGWQRSYRSRLATAGGRARRRTAAGGRSPGRACVGQKADRRQASGRTDDRANLGAAGLSCRTAGHGLAGDDPCSGVAGLLRVGWRRWQLSGHQIRHRSSQAGFVGGGGIEGGAETPGTAGTLAASPARKVRRPLVLAGGAGRSKSAGSVGILLSRFDRRRASSLRWRSPECACCRSFGRGDRFRYVGLVATRRTQLSEPGFESAHSRDRHRAASPEAAENIRGMKKAPMVKRAEELLAGTGWLPDVLELAQRSDDSPV